MQRRTFRAMGTEVELQVDAGAAGDALAAAETELHRLEALRPRFGPDVAAAGPCLASHLAGGLA